MDGGGSEDCARSPVAGAQGQRATPATPPLFCVGGSEDCTRSPAAGAQGQRAAPATPPLSALAIEIERAARTALDGPRFLHSRTVALHAADLCERYGLDPHKGWVAGLGHDLCKGLTTDEYLRMAAFDGLPVSDFEKAKPGMLHGRAAAVLLQTVFGIQDGEILEAVRLHTSGGRGMGGLAKIVYLTDKIEAGRHTVERRLRELAFGPPPNPPLDELFTTVLHATAAWLTGRGLALAPETLELLHQQE